MKDTPEFIESTSILPALCIFNAVFVLFNLIFKLLTMMINIPNAFILPIIIVILFISSFYAIQFFIKKNKRYFILPELILIIVGSVMCVWALNAFFDGVLLLHQSFIESLVNGAISALLQSIPIILAYGYLGRPMLTRFLVNQSYTSNQGS